VDPPHRPLDGADEVLLEEVAREVVGDDLGVAVAGERVARGGEFVADLVGVGEVAVVRKAERTALERDRERLCTGGVDRAGSRIPNVPDSCRSVERIEIVLAERVAHEPHLDMAVLLKAVVGNDSCGLLPTMLECVERVVQRSRRVPTVK